MIFETIASNFVVSVGNSMRARKIDEKMEDKILQNGLYHITTKEASEKILNEEGEAYFKTSSAISSYLTGFRKSVFFFSEISDKDIIQRNLQGNKEEMVMIHIPPEEVFKLLESNKLRYRTGDEAVMHIGEIRTKGNVYPLEEVVDKENFEGFKKYSDQNMARRLVSDFKLFGEFIKDSYSKTFNEIKDFIVKDDKKAEIEMIKKTKDYNLEINDKNNKKENINKLVNEIYSQLLGIKIPSILVD